MPFSLFHSDELAGFEESWQRNARENMPGRDPRMNMLGNGIAYSAPTLYFSRTCTQTFLFCLIMLEEKDGIEANFFLRNQGFDHNVCFFVLAMVS